MKRGNTALKRGVGLASAFALAIAGAVIAAPAANAAALALADGSIRATPAVDAPYLSTPVNYGNSYSTTNTTTVPNLAIGQNGQAASGVQIALPAALGAPGWDAGNKVYLKLGSSATAGATKVKFSQVPTTISLSKKAIIAADLANNAGFVGTNATPATSGTGTLTDNTVTGVLDSTGQILTITLPDPAHTGATGTAYLLSVSGINLDVPADQAPANSAVTVNASIDGTTNVAANVTTIAYTSSLKLALDGDASLLGGKVSLPPVVVAESSVAALGATGGTVVVTATGTDNGTPITVTQGANKALVGSSTVKGAGPAALGTTLATDLTNALNTATVTYVSSSVSASETIVISGLEVNNVKPGTDLTISITTPIAAAVNSMVGATQTFSFTAAQAAQASVVIKPGEVLPRISGANRYATAGDIASTLGVTDSIIVANGEDAKLGIDALSANFLAGVKGAPILLTQANTLSPDTKTALTKLFKSSTAHITVYVMGKTDSVSQAVRDAIVSTIKATAVSSIATVTVTEVAGDNRYETSVKTLAAAGGSTSAAYYDLGKGNLRTAFLASGQTNADALAAGAVSAGSAIPVLLTSNGSALPESVKAAIAANGIKQIIILGSTDRVSQAVEDALKADGVNVLRLAGTGTNGRFDTAVQIATLDRSAPTDGTGKAVGHTVYIANGVDGWADALAAGPLVADGHDSLITVGNGGGLAVSATLFLSNNKAPKLTGAIGLGGKDRVADSVITQATGLIS